MSASRPGQKTPGEMVHLQNGSKAGRYRCENPGCPATISANSRELDGRTRCFYCQEYGDGWWNLSVQERKERNAAQGGN